MADAERSPSAALKPPPAVEDFLREPKEHDFFAALRRLQAAWKALPPVGTALRPGDTPLRMRQEVSLAFPATSIASGAWNAERGRLTIDVRFAGLLGPNGPMPLHLTEYIIDRRRHADDPTLGAFLDIFHNRIFELFFLAWALNQPTVDHDHTARRRFAFYLSSLVGTATEGLQGRDSLPDNARLYYAGWLSGLARSPDGLASILADFLGVPTEVRSFQGRWLDLPQDSVCRVGASRASGTLGTSIYCGSRVWLAHLCFRIRIGPVGLADYERLLPGGDGFRAIADWVRFYLGDELQWELQLVLRRDDVPPCRLGGGVRLGWTTWGGSPAPGRDVDDLVLTGNS